MIDDMIRDKRSERSHQIELRRQSTAAGRRPAEASEGGSDTSSVQKLAESLSAIVETLNSASRGKGKGKIKKCQWPKIPPREASSRAGHIAECGGHPPAVAAA